MTDKISCPTLNVVLVKAIRALCEVTIKFDHTLEITGSLHIRSDGDKVLTCLLNEDCIKSPASPHLNDITLKLNLVNAALALNNIGVIHSNNNANNSSNNSLSQVTNDSLRNLSLQQNISLKNQNFFSVDAFTSRPLAVLSVSDTNNNNNNAANNGNNNPTNMLASNVNPFIINQIISPGDSNNNNNNVMTTGTNNSSNNNVGKISKNARTAGGGTRCKKRVDTVARTLANIKNASNDHHQQQQQQALDYNNQIDAPIKLPDIQTLAHRLPSYEVATGDLDTQGQKFKVKSPGAVAMVALKHSPSTIKKENNGNHQMEDSKMDAKLLNATSQQQQQQQKGQNRVKKFQCMFCGIFLSTKCYLKNHVNAMHTRLHVYKCDLCEHSFYSAGAMRIHKLRNHWIDSKKHRCSECNESFLLPIELRKHIQKRHASIANNVNVALTAINNNNNSNNFINNSNNNNSLNANNTIGNNVSINEVAGSSGIKSGFNDNSNNISNNGYMNVSGPGNNNNANNTNDNDGFDFTTAATSMNTYSLTTDNHSNNNFHKNINDYLAMNAGIINYTTINNNLVEVTDFNNNSSSINNNNNIDGNNNNMIDHNNISNKKGAVNLTMNSDNQVLNDVEQMKIEPQDQQHDLVNKKRILSTSASVTSSLSSTTSLQNFASEINGPS